MEDFSDGVADEDGFSKRMVQLERSIIKNGTILTLPEDATNGEMEIVIAMERIPTNSP